MKDDDNKKKQNPETLTFQKDRVFVYLITDIAELKKSRVHVWLLGNRGK